MHVRCKFDGGKVVNLCNRGSWNARCYVAAVRLNVGPQWAPTVWQKCTATVSGMYFEDLYKSRDTALQCTKACLTKPEQRSRRFQRKRAAVTESVQKKARREYGPEATTVEKDLDEQELNQAKEEFLNKHINLSDEKITAIFQQSKQQSRFTVWNTERKKRLTASNFGRVCKRNPEIPVKPLVVDMLHSKFGGNPFTMKGLQQERATIDEYVLRKAEEGINVTVEKTGLAIYKECKYLGASSDGKVTEHHNGHNTTGLLEVKNLLQNKPLSFVEATKRVKGFCLEQRSQDGKLQLKRNHPYYHQCQGQMNVCGFPWLDFVVRRTNPYQLHVERLTRDTPLWQNDMLSKLQAFYMEALLPEIPVPRDGKYPGIREPDTWVQKCLNEVY